MSKNPVFTAYWAGYLDTKTNPPPQTLDQTPSYVDTIILAFSGPAENGKTLSIDYLCSKYPAKTIIGWVKSLQARGQKVLMSLLDTPSTHWNNVDKNAFAQSVKEIAIGQWGLDGIDIDAESGMPPPVFVQNFVDLAKALRAALGSEALMTYTCYTGCYPGSNDYKILTQIEDEVDWINTMAYFDDEATMESLFKQYASVMGNSKVAIGVKAGKPGSGDQSTPLQEVIDLCRWQPTGDPKKGMMLWTLNRDNSYYTDKPEWTWTEAIHNNTTRTSRGKEIPHRSKNHTDVS